MNKVKASTCAAVAMAAMGIAAVTGCSSTPQTTSSAAATTNTSASPATATSPTTRPTTGPTAPPTSPSTTPAALPTLGRPAGVFSRGKGFGQVKPSEIFNGGDPTGLVTHVTWSGWGGPQAKATGVSDYVGPNQSVASGKQETAKIGRAHV